MKIRTRKFIGAIILISFVVTYALVAMSIGGLKLINVPEWQRFVFYIIAGVAWAIPAMLLIRWMQRPD